MTTTTPTMPIGTSYYAVVDAQDEHTPLAVLASVTKPDAWQQYRFDKDQKVWVEDPRVLEFLVGMEGDALRARTLTDDQAATILKGWGGKLATFAEGSGHWVTIDGNPVLIGGSGGGAGSTVRDRGAPATGTPPRGLGLAPDRALAFLRQPAGSLPRPAIEKLVSQALPSLPMVSLIDLSPSVIQPQMVALAEVAQDYPRAARNVDYVGVEHGVDEPSSAYGGPIGWDTSAYAEFAQASPPGSRAIGFNSAYFGNQIRGATGSSTHPTRFAAEMQLNVDKGWFPKQAAQPGWIAVHEYGHAVENDLFVKDAPAVFDFMRTQPPDPSLSLYSVSTDPATGEHRQNEQFADMFAAYYMGSDHPQAKAMGAFLKTQYGSAPRRSAL